MADDAHAAGIPDFWAVVPAGGPGSRLWPWSRRDHPKFLLDVLGHGSSLLQDTAARLRPLCAERLLVVTGRQHAAEVRAALPQLDAGRVLTEPAPRDSLPAIGLAAAWLEGHDPEAILGSFAADHVVTGQPRFEACVAEAVRVARQGRLVTLGVTPTRVATGFGYIHPGAALAQPGAPGATEPAPVTRQVLAFVEKPDEELAARYVDEGYLWNAGMFVARAGVLMNMIDRWQPELAAGLRAAAADPQDIHSLWTQLPRASIDRAVAEPAAREGMVAVVEAGFGWDDIGDFSALSAHLPTAEHHPQVRVGGDASLVLAPDSSGMVVAAGGRRVVALGVADVVIVDTPDAVLVTTPARAQEIKAVVEALREGGEAELT